MMFEGREAAAGSTVMSDSAETFSEEQASFLVLIVDFTLLTALPLRNRFSTRSAFKSAAIDRPDSRPLP